MPLRSYLAVIRKGPALIAFGFLFSFLSSFGQTYFISLFNGAFTDAFALSQAGFGSIYSLATLCSGLLLIRAGELIDRLPLRRLATVLLLGFSAATGWIYVMPSTSPAFLFVAIFLLRFLGQGLMSQTSVVSVARYFTAARGKAVALAALGYSAGEALFPNLGVALSQSIGWRETWGLAALLLLLVALPLTLWLLRGQDTHYMPQRAEAMDGQPTAAAPWTRRRVLADPFFLLLLPATLAPGFLVTGLFYMQVPLGAAKSWPAAHFALSVSAYAATTVTASILGGPLVDRLGPRRLYGWALLPLALALFLIGSIDAPWVAFAAMFAAGISTGLFHPCGAALWAETYGVGNLGTIRGMIGGFMVFSTALSPALIGFLLDGGVPVNHQLVGGGIYAVVALLLIPLAMARRAKPPINELL